MNALELEIRVSPDSYRDLDSSEVPIPPRGPIANLAPIGVGTSQVESLWSYLQRIADAHTLRLCDFLQFYLAIFLSDLDQDTSGSQTLKDLQAGANRGHYGARVAKVLEPLVGQSGLINLTLAPLDRIDGLRVAGASRSWCTQCLKQDQIPYERLSWSTNSASHCTIHGSALESECFQCGARQNFYSAKTDILRCEKCGFSRIDAPSRACDGDPESTLARWSSEQVAAILEAVQCGTISSRSLEIRDYNLRQTAALPAVGGITGLAELIYSGKATPCTWLNSGTSMDMIYAVRWSRLIGVRLDRLFSKKITSNEITLRSLPSACARKSKPRRKREPANTQLVMQTTLMLAEQNRFRAPRLDEIVCASGVHPKHVAYRDPHLVRLLRQLWLKERLIVYKQRVWREILDVHQAVVKTLGSNQPLSRRAVEEMMEQPGCFAGPIARNYFAWLERRFKTGDRRLLDPKLAPADVRAFWAANPH